MSGRILIVEDEREIAELLRSAAAQEDAELDAVDLYLAAALAGDLEAVRSADPALRAAARERRPGAVEEAVELRRPEAVRLLVEAGFSVHGHGDTTPLHSAAYEGDLELARLLVGLGADPDRPDPEEYLVRAPFGFRGRLEPQVADAVKPDSAHGVCCFVAHLSLAILAKEYRLGRSGGVRS